MRILERHGIVTAKTGYEEIRRLIEDALGKAEAAALLVETPGSDPRHPPSRMSRRSTRSLQLARLSPVRVDARTHLAQHYNELHALIVRAGNQFCRATPDCAGCPLKIYLPPADGATAGIASES